MECMGISLEYTQSHILCTSRGLYTNRKNGRHYLGCAWETPNLDPTVNPRPRGCVAYRSLNPEAASWQRNAWSEVSGLGFRA